MPTEEAVLEDQPTPAAVHAQPRLICYHARCDDGFGAAFAAWLELGDSARYLPLTHGAYALDTFGNVENEAVYILDFSVSKDFARRLIGEGAKSVTILDHHKSAMQEWQKEGNAEVSGDAMLVSIDERLPISAYFDMHRSGAQLAWEFFQTAPPPTMIDYIGDNDLWKHELPGSREFTRALRSYKMDFATWRQLAATPYAELIDDGVALQRAHNSAMEMVLALAPPVRVVLAGIAGLAINSNKMYASDIGHTLAVESGTFGAVWYAVSAQVVEVSLRSHGDFDVSAIAAQYGGGGHRNAAGFRIPLLQWVEMLEVTTQ